MTHSELTNLRQHKSVHIVIVKITSGLAARPVWIYCTSHSDARWRGGATGKAFGLAISTSRIQILLEATLRNKLRQVVYTYVPLSPSSITWNWPKGGDALRLGR